MSKFCDKYTVAELRRLASKQKIEGRSKLRTKTQLCNALNIRVTRTTPGETKTLEAKPYVPKKVCNLTSMHFTKGKKIGSGAYSTVFEGRTSRGEPVAIKEVSIGEKGVMLTNMFLREVAITELFSRNNVGPKFKEAYICEEKGIGFILSELWSRSLGWEIYNETYCLSKSHIKKLKHQVDTIHKLGFIHYDINKNNILIRGNLVEYRDYDDEDYGLDEDYGVSDVTLADFGMTVKTSTKVKGLDVVYEYHKGIHPGYFKKNSITLADVKQNPTLFDEGFFWYYETICKGKKPWPLPVEEVIS